MNHEFGLCATLVFVTPPSLWVNVTLVYRGLI